MHIKQLKPVLEAILFLQTKPMALYRLQELVDEAIEAEVYREALQEIIQDYQNSERGIELVELAGGYIFRTKVEHRDLIRRMQQITPIRMSQAMLEVLSIIAFYQPVTREKLEEIRGVECGHHLRNLMEKRLVRLSGRSDDVGKPMLYSTTKEFLELFGLAGLQDMPTLREIEELLPKNEVGEADDEERRVRTELQEIVAEARPLEFSDIELEEQRLFGEDHFAEAGENKKSADGDASATPDHASTPNEEAGGATKHFADEVAGPIAFGSPSAAQEATWENDQPVETTRASASIAAEERQALLDENESSETGTPTEAFIDERSYQPEKS